MRLDRGEIDRSGFDREYQFNYVFLGCQINGSGDVVASLLVPATLSTVIDGSGDVVATLYGPVHLAAVIDGSGDVTAFLATSEAIEITYSGTLEAGKTICIDANDFTVLNDGSNDIGNYTGEFPEIYNTTVILYTDSEVSRSLDVTITRSDRTP